MEIIKGFFTLIESLIFTLALLSPIIVIIVIIIYLKRQEEYKLKNQLSNKQTTQIQQTAKQEFISPYTINNFLLTSHEADFYKDLKPIADKYNLIILCKMRMADILTVKPHIKNQQFYYWFQKISQKHIDFVLCNKSFIPAVFIEIDDYTHNRADRQESDNFKNNVFKDTHLKLLRFRSWTSEEIENNIKDCLNLEAQSQQQSEIKNN